MPSMGLLIPLWQFVITQKTDMERNRGVGDTVRLQIGTKFPVQFEGIGPFQAINSFVYYEKCMDCKGLRRKEVARDNCVFDQVKQHNYDSLPKMVRSGEIVMMAVEDFAEFCTDCAKMSEGHMYMIQGEIHADSIDPYLVGCYVQCGFYDEYQDQLVFLFDKIQGQKSQFLLDHLVQMDICYKLTKRRTLDIVAVELCRAPAKLRKAMLELNLLSCKSGDGSRAIPEYYIKHTNRTIQKQLLAGMIDAHGIRTSNCLARLVINTSGGTSLRNSVIQLLDRVVGKNNVDHLKYRAEKVTKGVFFNLRARLFDFPAAMATKVPLPEPLCEFKVFRKVEWVKIVSLSTLPPSFQLKGGAMIGDKKMGDCWCEAIQMPEILSLEAQEKRMLCHFLEECRYHLAVTLKNIINCRMDILYGRTSSETTEMLHSLLFPAECKGNQHTKSESDADDPVSISTT